MAFSKYSILIIEDDSHVSRVLRHHLEQVFENVRITVAGSAQKAREITEKFPPDVILWDGVPNERGTLEEYLNCIPQELWPRVTPISTDPEILKIAQERGARPPVCKKEDAVNKWSEEMVIYLKKLMPRKKK